MPRQLSSIHGNAQRLDGGAMFGNVPKNLWQKWIVPDEQNRIPLCCRALLVEDDDRKVLFEAGIGAFFSPKLKDRFGVIEESHVLLESLAERGLSPEDIDIVVLSHLHFDHAGGLLSAYQEGQAPKLLFPNATFMVGEDAWGRSQKPHARDRASFIPELQELLLQSKRLHIIKDIDTPGLLGAGYRFHLSHGHTPGLLLSEIDMPDGPIVFAGDLIPGEPWVHLPITMGYDRYPELLIDEKEKLLTDLVARRGRLFFTHDHGVALGRVHQNEDQRFSLIEQQAEFSKLSH
ncbi:MAG: MBL fold metallo-hydrolase [Myxococcota bacterium]|jgi:glyoxylase-like metal-dependent hydrolase (beta-lactamase superfamily II)|nr:MBL fold metallo-hydrolase [Myxococcota bacterium]